MKNNDWIPCKEKLPEEWLDVQITYLGHTDNKPYCNEFAYLNNNKWYWGNGDGVCRVEVIAWKYNCEPYILKEN